MGGGSALNTQQMNNFVNKIKKELEITYKTIEMQIKNNTYDWENGSYEIIRNYPEFFDPDKFNWKDCSAEILYSKRIYLFDPDKYNWKDFSCVLLSKNPELFDPDKFNWKKNSDIIVTDHKYFFDKKKYNWKKFSNEIIKYGLEFFDSKLFNWKENSDSLAFQALHLFDPKKFNWDIGSVPFIQAKQRYLVKKFFNPDKFNWKKGSEYLIKFEYFDLIDPDKFDYYEATQTIINYSQFSLINEKINWKDYSSSIFKKDVDLVNYLVCNMNQIIRFNILKKTLHKIAVNLCDDFEFKTVITRDILKEPEQILDCNTLESIVVDDKK